MPASQEPPPVGDGPAGFVYDFNTLYDMVDRQRTNAGTNDWLVTIVRDGDEMTLRCVKGKTSAYEQEQIADLDFDAAAARLGPRLSDRGVLP